MNPTRFALPRPRFGFWLVGVLALASAGLTVWALSSRAEAPAAAAPPATGPSEPRNFLGFADLDQGVTPLYPVQPGRVVKVFAHDGDVVSAGAPLLALDDKAATAQVEAAEADLADAKVQLEQANKLQSQHQAQIDGQQQVVEARKQEAAAARAKADEADKLNRSETHAVSDESARAADAQAKALDATVRAEEAKLRLLQLDDPTFGVRRAEAAVQGKEAQMRIAKLALQECTVFAPVKGQVERTLVSEGQALGPNAQQPAVLFAADGLRVIRTEVEQEWAGQVALGQSAKVEDFYDSKPNSPSWRGRVTRVSDWYAHRRSMLMEPLQFNDVRTLECIVTLDPDQKPLKVGQRVRVALGGGGS